MRTASWLDFSLLFTEPLAMPRSSRAKNESAIAGVFKLIRELQQLEL